MIASPEHLSLDQSEPLADSEAAERGTPCPAANHPILPPAPEKGGPY